MQKRIFLGWWLFLFWVNGLQAHIGSPNIVYEGKAGPYHILVNIKPPEVVPGQADISVKVVNEEVDGVFIQPIFFKTGSDGAPKPEAIEGGISGDPSLYFGKLWLMRYGSASVKVIIEGWKGRGSTVIPVPALATARKGMDKQLIFPLIFLGCVLFFGAVTLIYASVGQATLAPGSALTRSKRNRSIVISFISLMLLLGMLRFVSQWWNNEEQQYIRYMYRPVELSVDLTSRETSFELDLHLLDEGHFDRKPGDLIPDHKKLMHVFMISKENMDHFAHVHPLKVDSVNFKVSLPKMMPSGKYFLFADIVHQSGLSETLQTEVVIPEENRQQEKIASSVSNPALQIKDQDDSYLINGVNVLTEDVVDVQAERLEFQSIKNKYKANDIQVLSFQLRDSAGKSLQLEPYLGMLGHAAICRSDGSVFIHLHPVGTVSMAAQEQLANKVTDDQISLCLPIDSVGGGTVFSNSPLGPSTMSETVAEQLESTTSQLNTVSFPYVFPKEGNYRMWVQVKYNQRIVTESFDFQVEK